MRGRRFESKPGGAQHRRASAALRGEDERGHPARSSTSLMTAAAVSSIERRVTSITGQPLSANIRRAKAISAMHRSSSKIGRASCRERVCQYVVISVVAGYFKQKKKQ